MTIVLTHDLETFDSANAVFDMNTNARLLTILLFLLGGQFTAPGFFMRDFNTRCSFVSQIALFAGVRKLIRDATGFVNLLVGGRPAVARISARARLLARVQVCAWLRRQLLADDGALFRPWRSKYHSHWLPLTGCGWRMPRSF